MKNRKLYFVVISLIFSLSSVVFAHAGHGNENNSSSFTHYLTEPLHLGIGIIVIALIGLTIYKLKQSKLETVALF